MFWYVLLNFIEFCEDLLINKMSRAKKNSQATVKPKFDTKPYERPGLTESDILEIREHFDLFDREHVGSINPKGTIYVT